LTRRALDIKAVNCVLLFALRQSTGSNAVTWLQAGASLFVMDGNALVNRSGPRLVESAEAIAEVKKTRHYTINPTP